MMFSNRVLMVGYGAYGESLDVNFEARNYPLLKSGAILALCHVRYAEPLLPDSTSGIQRS